MTVNTIQDTGTKHLIIQFGWAHVRTVKGISSSAANAAVHILSETTVLIGRVRHTISCHSQLHTWKLCREIEMADVNVFLVWKLKYQSFVEKPRTEDTNGVNVEVRIIHDLTVFTNYEHVQLYIFLEKSIFIQNCLLWARALLCWNGTTPAKFGIS